jgi:hypothetical protein
MARVYVRKNGDPSNSGFIYSPFSLISDALAVLESGDVLDIGPGEFTEDSLDFTSFEGITVNASYDSFIVVRNIFVTSSSLVVFKGGHWDVGQIGPLLSTSYLLNDSGGRLLADDGSFLIY